MKVVMSHSESRKLETIRVKILSSRLIDESGVSLNLYGQPRKEPFELLVPGSNPCLLFISGVLFLCL